MFHIDSEQNKNCNTNNSNYQSEISSQVKEPQNDNNNKEKLDNNTKKGLFSFRKKKKEERNKTSNVNPNTNNSDYQPEISSQVTEPQDCINNEEKFHNNINYNLKNSPETNLNIANYNANISKENISNNGPDTNFKIKGLELHLELNAFKDSDQKITNSENTTDLDNATNLKNMKGGILLKLSLESIEVAGFKKLIENLLYHKRS